MAWWPLWGGQRGRLRVQNVDVVAGLAGQRVAAGTAVAGVVAGVVTGLEGGRLELPSQRTPDRTAAPITMRRVGEALDRLEIRYLTDEDGGLLAMWERHAVLFALEGPDDEILVMRGRPHGTVHPDWSDRSYRVVNEWNHTRRFCKAYVGDPTERGMLPVYAEIQIPLASGVHDPLLDEMLDCAAAVTSTFVDWLYDEGGLL
jgi:hypothetical protein